VAKVCYRSLSKKAKEQEEIASYFGTEAITVVINSGLTH
jgi:hypothetical protein